MSNARRSAGVLPAATLLAALVSCAENGPSAATPSAPASVADALQATDDEEFRKALAPVPLRFPRDHGPHEAFRTEWWYFTGNVITPQGRRFGYQFTLFRIALSPRRSDSASAWATNQAYMAHLAVTDIDADAFHHDERVARGALGLAGVSASPFRAWLEDWSVVSVAEIAQTPCNGCMDLRIAASNDSVALALTLVGTKPAALHGRRGLSQKSDRPGNASYYYSLPRLETRGTITIGEQLFPVEGASWFDHEWSTSYLERDQAGWDWFSVHLPGATDIMFFRLRARDPGGRDFVSGSYIEADGTVVPLTESDVRLEVLGSWTSPHTGIVYPGRWRVELLTRDTVLHITPWVADQEMNRTFRYWEGAVRVDGRMNDLPLTGHGYVELTGYR